MKQVYRFRHQAPMQAYSMGGALLLVALIALLALFAVIQYAVFNLEGGARILTLIVGPLSLGAAMLFATRGGVTAIGHGRWMARTTLEVDESGMTVCAGSTLALHSWDQVRSVWMSGGLKAVQVAGTSIWVGEIDDPEGFARSVISLKEKG